MKQVAVITGANGRIGQATCARLMQSGYLAVGIDIGADGRATGRTTNATWLTCRRWTKPWRASRRNTA